MLPHHGPAHALAFTALLCLASPVFNELVIRPAAGEGEWVELLNPGTGPVSLSGWVLRDGTGKSYLLPPAAEVGPGGFLVLASRPESLRVAYALPGSIRVLRPDGWPTLNDRDASRGRPADVLVLEPPGGPVADSVAYYEAWLPPRPGRSLERVDTAVPGVVPAAWGWSEDPSGATPGRSNSLVTEAAPGDPGAVWSGPRRVEPRRRAAVYGYRFPGPGTLAVWLLEPEGRVVEALSAPHPVPAAGHWVWSATQPLPTRAGLYFLCVRWRGKTSVRRCLPVWVTP